MNEQLEKYVRAWRFFLGDVMLWPSADIDEWASRWVKLVNGSDHGHIYHRSPAYYAAMALGGRRENVLDKIKLVKDIERAFQLKGSAFIYPEEYPDYPKNLVKVEVERLIEAATQR